MMFTELTLNSFLKKKEEETSISLKKSAVRDKD